MHVVANHAVTIVFRSFTTADKFVRKLPLRCEFFPAVTTSHVQVSCLQTQRPVYGSGLHKRLHGGEKCKRIEI